MAAALKTLRSWAVSQGNIITSKRNPGLLDLIKLRRLTPACRCTRESEERREEKEYLFKNKSHDLPEYLQRLPFYILENFCFPGREGEGQLTAGVAQGVPLYLEEKLDSIDGNDLDVPECDEDNANWRIGE
jgi:hypothetical protein